MNLICDLQKKIDELDAIGLFYKKTRIRIGDASFYQISLIEDESVMKEQWFIDMDFDTPNFYYFDSNGKEAEDGFYEL